MSNISDKDTILEHILSNASFDGWSNETFEKSAKDANLDTIYAYTQFPKGISDAANYYIEKCDREMLAKIAKIKLKDIRIRDRISTAILTRLEIYEPHKESVRRLVSYFAMPQNVAAALAHLGQTCNQIWYAAGDNSTDFNYYTKRLTLSGVYSSTLLFWLNDESEDYTKTKDFLDRRIANVMKIQKAKTKGKEILGKITSPLAQKFE